jgi:hypothetical protein
MSIANAPGSWVAPGVECINARGPLKVHPKCAPPTFLESCRAIGSIGEGGEGGNRFADRLQTQAFWPKRRKFKLC